MDLLPYCEGGFMIPVDLSANCEVWIYDPNGSRIQLLGIRSRDQFLGSRDMSDADQILGDIFPFGLHNEVVNDDQ